MAPSTSRFVLLERRTLSISIVFILALAITAPAVAEYLGPDRVTTEFKNVHVPEKDVWTLTHDPEITDEKPYVCLIIHPCAEHPSVDRQKAVCVWKQPADNSGCTEWWEEQEVTVTYPEATIAAELLNCPLVDGWCTSSPTLSLTGAEPVAGETITLIEGTRNGEVFACADVTCSVPLLQGQNDFTFWAHSSWGDTSQMGALSAKLDSEGPSIGIPDAWIIWEPLAIQVEDERGIELIELTIKGGEYGNRYYQWNLANLPNDWIWDRYFGEIVAPIGEYPVTVEAWDGLGNGSTAHGTIVIPPPDEENGGDSDALLAGERESVAEESAEQGASPGEGEPAEGDSDGAPSESDPNASVAGETTLATGTDAIEAGGPASASTTDGQQTTTAVPPTSSGGSTVLWGAAAAAAIGAATAYGLNRKKQREAAIEAKRKELAERRSARSFTDHLQSLRQAAYARIEPAVIQIKVAALVAAAAASAAAERLGLVQEKAAELDGRLGEREDPAPGEWIDPSPSRTPPSQHPTTAEPESVVDSWQRIELQRAREFAGYSGQPPQSEPPSPPPGEVDVTGLPFVLEEKFAAGPFTIPSSPFASTTYRIDVSASLRTLAETAAVTAQLSRLKFNIAWPPPLLGGWSVNFSDGALMVYHHTPWLSPISSPDSAGAEARLRWKASWGVGNFDGEFGIRSTAELQSSLLVGGNDVSRISASIDSTSRFRPQNMLLYGGVALAVGALAFGIAPLTAAVAAAAGSLGLALGRLGMALGR